MSKNPNGRGLWEDFGAIRDLYLGPDATDADRVVAMMSAARTLQKAILTRFNEDGTDSGEVVIGIGIAEIALAGLRTAAEFFGDALAAETEDALMTGHADAAPRLAPVA